MTLHLTGQKASFLCNLEPSSYVPQLVCWYCLFFRIWSLAAYHPIAQFLSKLLTHDLTHVISIQRYCTPTPLSLQLPLCHRSHVTRADLTLYLYQQMTLNVSFLFICLLLSLHFVLFYFVETESHSVACWPEPAIELIKICLLVPAFSS